MSLRIPIIRILDLCGRLGIDIEGHIKYKMEYNSTKTLPTW